MGKQSKAAISLIVLTTTFAFLLPGCGGPHYPSSRAGQILQKADKAMSGITSYKEQSVRWTHIEGPNSDPKRQNHVGSTGNLEIRKADTSTPTFHYIISSPGLVVPGISPYEMYGLGGYVYVQGRDGKWTKKFAQAELQKFVTPKDLATMSRNSKDIQITSQSDKTYDVSFQMKPLTRNQYRGAAYRIEKSTWHVIRAVIEEQENLGSTVFKLTTDLTLESIDEPFTIILPNKVKSARETTSY